MNQDFYTALDLLEKEKGIPKEYMIEKIEAALANACRKEVGQTTVVRVQIDPVKQDMKVFQQRTRLKSWLTKTLILVIIENLIMICIVISLFL